MRSEEIISSGLTLYVSATFNFLFGIEELIQIPFNCLLPIYSFKIFFQEKVKIFFVCVILMMEVRMENIFG